MAFNIFATATSDIPLANLDANFTLIGTASAASILYPTATTSITYGTTGTGHIFAGALVGPASATVFNTVSTTVNAFGAATTLNIGSASTTAGTVYLPTVNAGLTTISVGAVATPLELRSTSNTSRVQFTPAYGGAAYDVYSIGAGQSAVNDFGIRNMTDGRNDLLIDGTGAVTIGGTLGVTGIISANNANNGIQYASSGGSGLHVYGGAGTHQWDIYLNSTNLRIGDNTGGGSVVIDTALSVGGTSTVAAVNASGDISTKVVGSVTNFQVGDLTNANSSSRITIGAGLNNKAWRIGVQDLVNAAITFTPATANGGTTFTTPALTIEAAGAVTIPGTLDVTGAAAFGGATVAAPQVSIDGTNATNKSYRLYSAGTSRWLLQSLATTHTFDIKNDVAASTLSITQAGAVTIPGTLKVGGTPAAGSYPLYATGVNAGVLLVENSGAGSAAQTAMYIINGGTSADNQFIHFYTDGTAATATLRGSITYNRAGGLVAYNVTSDHRAKDITGKYEASGETIDQLQVYMGKMKGATIARPMMIAHEAASVVPYAVTGEKDAEDEKGDPIYQSMDHQIFVPLLIAEVQSLRNRLKQLENRTPQ